MKKNFEYRGFNEFTGLDFFIENIKNSNIKIIILTLNFTHHLRVINLIFKK